MSIAPLLEALGLVEVTHDAKGDRMRAVALGLLTVCNDSEPGHNPAAPGRDGGEERMRVSPSDR